MRKNFWIFLFCFSLPLLSQAAAMIRVELTHAPTFEISCPEELQVSLSGGRPIFLGRFATFRSEPEGIYLNGRLFKTDGMVVHPNGPFLWNKHHYWGTLELRQEVGALEAINVLDLEKYLISVVGSEMSSRWPLEALKAQAVVARTYALEKMKEHRELSFDVVGNYMDQAYEGLEGESPSSEEAVHDTRGEVLVHQGEVITAYYHADCGGRTEKGSRVFPGDLPYLQSVVCPYGQDSPYRRWSKSYSLVELSQRLGKNIQKLTLSEDPETGRVAFVTLETSAGKEFLTGFAFRKLLGTRNLRSTQFNLEETDKTVYVSREEILPPQYVTEYISKKILESKQEVATEPLALADKVYLMQRTGALLNIDVSNANPLVAISGGGFLSTVFHDLAAITTRMKMLRETVSTPYITREPVRKRTVWVPMKVPVEVTFTGKGWGHGVGLCQWGSRGMALLGKNYKEILHFYYQDVELKK